MILHAELYQHESLPPCAAAASGRSSRRNAAIRRDDGRQALKPTGEPGLDLRCRPLWRRSHFTVLIAALQSMLGTPSHALIPRCASRQCQPGRGENVLCQFGGGGQPASPRFSGVGRRAASVGRRALWRERPPASGVDPLQGSAWGCQRNRRSASSGLRRLEGWSRFGW